MSGGCLSDWFCSMVMGITGSLSTTESSRLSHQLCLAIPLRLIRCWSPTRLPISLHRWFDTKSCLTTMASSSVTHKKQNNHCFSGCLSARIGSMDASDLKSRDRVELSD